MDDGEVPDGATADPDGAGTADARSAASAEAAARSEHPEEVRQRQLDAVRGLASIPFGPGADDHPGSSDDTPQKPTHPPRKMFTVLAKHEQLISLPAPPYWVRLP
jgi:hypothetical protein